MPIGIPGMKKNWKGVSPDSLMGWRKEAIEAIADEAVNRGIFQPTILVLLDLCREMAIAEDHLDEKIGFERILLYMERHQTRVLRKAIPMIAEKVANMDEHERERLERKTEREDSETSSAPVGDYDETLRPLLVAHVRLDRDCYPTKGLVATLQQFFDGQFGNTPGVKVDEVHNFNDFTYDIKIVVRFDPQEVIDKLHGIPWVESVASKPVGLFRKAHVLLEKTEQVG